MLTAASPNTFETPLTSSVRTMLAASLAGAETQPNKVRPVLGFEGCSKSWKPIATRLSTYFGIGVSDLGCRDYCFAGCLCKGTKDYVGLICFERATVPNGFIEILRLNISLQMLNSVWRREGISVNSSKASCPK